MSAQFLPFPGRPLATLSRRELRARLEASRDGHPDWSIRIAAARALSVAFLHTPAPSRSPWPLCPL
jgi:hypothetical protein